MIGLRRKATPQEERIIRAIARAGLTSSRYPQPLGQRLKAEQQRKEQGESWLPKIRT
jgi:hypothetical protein